MWEKEYKSFKSQGMSPIAFWIRLQKDQFPLECVVCSVDERTIQKDRDKWYTTMIRLLLTVCDVCLRDES